ncbi:pyocin activator PrtN family protein [Vibrio atlanticus]|uniref:Pyocin activator protein PrtN n=1 Tax=Vibrio atlanticus TaxID=693153 RepID=A0A1C3IVT4_9VIBR|nr:pyocin activator PrtN family protein [Vibrio atlanticus]SBS65533.1 Pyocin activator protein PrtN [Vibrio atlanticus]
MNQSSLKKRVLQINAQYGAEVPVSAICQRYFNCSVKTANERIKAKVFPLPAYRTTDSNSGDYYIDADDLAALIERKHSEAKVEWEAANGKAH